MSKDYSLAQIARPSRVAPNMHAAGSRATQAAHVNRLLRLQRAGRGGTSAPMTMTQPHGASHPSVGGYVGRALSEIGMRMFFG